MGEHVFFVRLNKSNQTTNRTDKNKGLFYIMPIMRKCSFLFDYVELYYVKYRDYAE